MLASLLALTLAQAPGPTPPPTATPYWVFFRDRGGGEIELAAALERRRRELSPRALARRIRVRGDQGVDRRDLPPAPEYVDAIITAGGRVRVRSRWLNGISVEADADALAAIGRLPFVAALRPVARARRRPESITPAPLPRQALGYGAAQAQLDLLNVPAMRECGLDGAGVVIGVQDSGFDLSHQALAKAAVIAAHDFVQDDEVVADQPGDAMGQDNHGTMVLSLIAGQDGDAYSGVAPAASFILAKTERIDVEAPFEEDLFVAGLEWIEGMGADLFTASLGYIDWYTYDDLDGATTVVAQAASVALDNGLIMLAAMGNLGPVPKSLITPADVDRLISIGATDLEGTIVEFSSRGPTADGRIKPDVVAPGAGVIVVHPDQPTDYVAGGGTSFATPLAAGVVALLLQADPDRTPVEVGMLLRESAKPYGPPNNDTGWGLIDGLAAAGLHCSCVDADGDEHFDEACGGDDCDDANPARHPGAAEICDGLDDDCDGVLPPDEVDADDDGALACAGECDDHDPARYPGALELCDGVDNDCDGIRDEGCTAATGGGGGTAGSTGAEETGAGTAASTAADASATASATAGESAGDDKAGCACASGSPPTPAAHALLLLALGGLLRRRRPAP